MITDLEHFSSFKRLTLAKEHLSLEQKYRILQSLYDEARKLGSFGEHNMLLGLDDDIRLAAALNAVVGLNVPGVLWPHPNTAGSGGEDK